MSAISTKRIVARKTVPGKARHFGWVMFLVAGIVMFAAGLKTEIGVLLIPGFVGVVGGLLYFNAFFWERVIAAKHRRDANRASRSVTR